MDLAIFVYLGLHLPLLRLPVLLENFRLVVAATDGQHEADRAPAALPDRALEFLFLYQLPLLICAFPDLEFFVFAARGNRVTRGADVVAPCDVANPVVVSSAVVAELLS